MKGQNNDYIDTPWAEQAQQRHNRGTKEVKQAQQRHEGGKTEAKELK